MVLYGVPTRALFAYMPAVKAELVRAIACQAGKVVYDKDSTETARAGLQCMSYFTYRSRDNICNMQMSSSALQ